MKPETTKKKTLGLKEEIEFSWLGRNRDRDRERDRDADNGAADFESSELNLNEVFSF